MKFKELEKISTSEMENKILSRWKKMDILNETIENRKNGKDFVFYDGPIYANAKPGIHHVFAKTIKDAFCKYKTMKGYRVLRKIGLDTHGLPIEVNVEKKLGFKNKSDIEKLGIEKFCDECKKETASNIGEVKKVTDMMGQFIDCDNPYITCSNEYIESEWWIVNELNKKGLIYYGNKVLPYCPRCGTELASHEVSQGYKEVSVNTVIVPFKIKNENTYFLVWTTTPWTLMANVALCVNSNFTYVKVNSKGYNFIVSEKLAPKVLGDDYQILKTYRGSDLVGIEYEQFMPFVNVVGSAFKVVSDDYVTDENGTGIVHIAPAFGADDNRVCVLNKLAFINPVDKNGCYDVGPFKGRLVTDPTLEIDIIKYLKENDKLFKKIKMKHDYPHCWRCKQPLIYYSKPAWYVRNTSYKKQIIEANKTIKWHPDYIGTKRFNNWLENMIDWGISRNRYWGCPLPIWHCDCGHFQTIGSIEELREKSIENLDLSNIELHRPYVDNIKIKCEKCGKSVSRVKDVLDVWFDSGVMPYAQFHYPFENKKLFESQFPADFIAEGVDQTRGWFYVLLVLSTLISGKASFKNVLVNDMMLDSEGKKMSKSTGNIIDPIKIMEEYGADPIRFYMLETSPVWTPMKFDYDGLKEVNSKFISTLKNTYNFFCLYANADNINPNTFQIPYEKRAEIDKWLLSKYNKLVRDVTKCMDNYDLTTTTRMIQNFVLEDLSNWYIRRNRRRFWSSIMDDDKKAVYNTTYEVLKGICLLVAPIVPFLSEEIYTHLTNKKSVHLEDYPIFNDEYIDEYIEQRMDLVRQIISLGRNIREEVKIKVRQPISEALIDLKNKEMILDLIPLIKEELNVKEVLFIDDISSYMNFTVKPNFKEVGRIMGSKIKEFQMKLQELSIEDINKLRNNKTITIKLNDEDFEVNDNMVIINSISKEGFDVAILDNNFIILNTELNENLILEGIAREFVSKVQNIRKEKNYDITDRINIFYSGDVDIDKSIDEYKEFIKNETLAIELIKKNVLKEYDLNGHKTYIDIEINN